MMVILSLVVLLAVEAFFLAWAVKSKSSHTQEKNVVHIAELALFGILTVTGVFQWGFRWYFILAALVILSTISVVTLVRKTEKPYNLGKSIRRFIGIGFLFTFALLPAMLFLQYSPPTPTGSDTIETAKYTWVDDSRIETFSNTGENRALTVDFWYPQDATSKVPLVVFSHGAFGYNGSNQSTFAELTSHGYVVASIGHTYHAFITKDTSGNVTLVNMAFLNSVMTVNSRDDIVQDYYDSHVWLDLRVADENFILDTITASVNTANADDPIFSIIDLEHIGLIGHSLGGASSAVLGRERSDVDAVIDLDGSMLGEELGVENGKIVLNDTPYPIPLLNLYAEDHYESAITYFGSEQAADEGYDNFYASRNAVCAYEVIFKNAGHLNFTDLPLYSPALAKLLGTGTIGARYCIEKTNSIVLEFFDCYLKGGPTPNFEREY